MKKLYNNLGRVATLSLFSLGVFGGFQWATNIFLALVWFVIISSLLVVFLPDARKKLIETKIKWNKYSTLYHFILIVGMIGAGWIVTGIFYTIAIYIFYIVSQMEGCKDD